VIIRLVTFRLGSLTFSALEAGDFVKLVLLYTSYFSFALPSAGKKWSGATNKP